MFKCDFTAEREARSRLATEKDRLLQELEAEQLKNQGLADQLTRYTQQQLQDMQLRASQGTGGSPFYHPAYPYPAQPEAYPQGAGYPMAGGGGDGGGGQFNNLSGGEGAQAMHGQLYGEGEGGGGGGQAYNRGGQQHYGGGGGGQNYPGGPGYGVAGQEGLVAHHPPAGQSMYMQRTRSDQDYAEVHAQYQHAQVRVLCSL